MNTKCTLVAGATVTKPDVKSKCSTGQRKDINLFCTLADSFYAGNHETSALELL